MVTWLIQWIKRTLYKPATGWPRSFSSLVSTTVSVSAYWSHRNTQAYYTYPEWGPCLWTRNNGGLMLGQRRRRWIDIKSLLAGCFCLPVDTIWALFIQERHVFSEDDPLLSIADWFPGDATPCPWHCACVRGKLTLPASGQCCANSGDADNCPRTDRNWFKIPWA